MFASALFLLGASAARRRKSLLSFNIVNATPLEIMVREGAISSFSPLGRGGGAVVKRAAIVASSSSLAPSFMSLMDGWAIAAPPTPTLLAPISAAKGRLREEEIFLYLPSSDYHRSV